MGGGIIQLVAVGSQDMYLTGNPDFTYFAMVFKKHTNFSMESIKLAFITNPTLGGGSGGTYTCRIDRNADLMKEVYLSFALPDIYSSDIHRFQWIKNIGTYMIRQYTLSIGGVVIDTQYGEWMDIWTELSMPESKRATYNKMIGNVEEFTAPKSLAPEVIVISNQLTYSSYPVGVAGSPSIAGRRFYVPLNFWFCKTSSLALPLAALQYQFVEITFNFRPINELYQIFDRTLGKYVSPSYFESRHLNKIGDPLSGSVDISRFLSAPGTPVGTSVIDMKAYLEVNYIYLDTPELNVVAGFPHDYLIETLTQLTPGEVLAQSTIDIVLQNPCKELVWITRRTDAVNYNEWANYTNNMPEDSTKPILKTAHLTFNGSDRFSEKEGDYFNLLQPYQHHTNSPRQGIYVYSFALYPEKPQPSGSCNMSMINTVSLTLTLNPPTDDSYRYNVVIYALKYNVLRVISGSGGVAFQE